MRAENHGQIKSTGSGDFLRATLAEVSGMTLTRNWQNEVQSTRKHLWLTDCKSFHDYVTNPIAAGTEDVRLEIDLEQIRQDLWEFTDGSPKDHLEEEQHNKVRWIDTSTMLADCVTKYPKLKADRDNKVRLVQFLQTCELDFSPSPEAQMKKVYQQSLRAKAKARKNELKLKSHECEI